MFGSAAPGTLVPIHGTDPVLGEWTHRAFVPDPLPEIMPALSPETFMAVAEARASLAALDATARQLPNPGLLRLPALRREAQSTSALEGTYAPLAEVLTADDERPPSEELVEILNYVRMANTGFARLADGWPLTPTFLADLQGTLMQGTPLESESGRLRGSQVVIGRTPGANPAQFPVLNARFVPVPPGQALETGVHDLVDWLRDNHHANIDPVVAAGMSHYQFETLHPFRDGNGRVGRFLIVLHLQIQGILSEPTLTVSPWFESRRSEYYDHLLRVSTSGDWNGFLRFFADGLRQSADATRQEMIDLVAVQAALHESVRASALRADSAHSLVDLAVANPSFTVRKVEAELDISYGRANALVGQLVDLGVLGVVDPNARNRRFFAPDVLTVLSRERVRAPEV